MSSVWYTNQISKLYLCLIFSRIFSTLNIIDLQVREICCGHFPFQNSTAKCQVLNVDVHNQHLHRFHKLILSLLFLERNSCRVSFRKLKFCRVAWHFCQYNFHIVKVRILSVKNSFELPNNQGLKCCSYFYIESAWSKNSTQS